MRENPSHGMGGEGKFVEADETYVGGKARNRAYKEAPKKEPVIALVERKGRVRDRRLRRRLRLAHYVRHRDRSRDLHREALQGERALHVVDLDGHRLAAELTIAVDDLRAQPAAETPPAQPPARQVIETPAQVPPAESSERIDLSEGDPEQMIDAARKSREEATKLRQEAEQARHELER